MNKRLIPTWMAALAISTFFALAAVVHAAEWGAGGFVRYNGEARCDMCHLGYECYTSRDAYMIQLNSRVRHLTVKISKDLHP